MAQQGGDLDRNEPATEFKLEKARRRGSVPRSNDLTFAGVLLAAVACVHGLAQASLIDGALMLRRGLGFASREELSTASALAYAETLVVQVLIAVTPIVAVLWLVAASIAAAQARGVLTAEPLKPDLSRLNPATGLKRLFSVRALHDLVRSTVKLVAIATAMAVWGWHHLDAMLRLAAASPAGVLEGGLALLGSAFALLAGLLVALAILDWGFNRWEFMRQMRMSKREVKDEHKEREGDPRIRARLRELRLEWFKRARQLSQVRSADVLITNPTHYAVALVYKRADMPAPMITARGAGEMAQRMRWEARRHCVPVVENAPLARSLFSLNESQAYVPQEHFDVVARILRWVYAAPPRRRVTEAPSA